jgi:hypothetical protein
MQHSYVINLLSLWKHNEPRRSLLVSTGALTQQPLKMSLEYPLNWPVNLNVLVLVEFAQLTSDQFGKAELPLKLKRRGVCHSMGSPTKQLNCITKWWRL